MSEPAPSATPEPHPFQKFTEFAKRIVNVPKTRADEEENRIREERAEKKRAKR
jgi:hypothetical protein